ncbi:MAG: adenine deaminase [Methyloprofundus sp.]|nr:adenine deaminase [Methyloprofundus sp.]
MNNRSGKIQINIVDILQQHIFLAELSWDKGIIQAITPLAEEDKAYSYLIPGFIDAHVHIESSMLTPVEFSRLATRHGTVASVSDPHEIANVMGLEGMRFMLDNAEKTAFKIFFGAPSCVPATPFETAGAVLNAEHLEGLFKAGDVSYLSEVMNYPDVLNKEPKTLAKLALAQSYSCPIDGHAPGLSGSQVEQYAQAGISTDHECSTLAEAKAKLAAGMKILIREGSAARNFDTLHSLISLYPEQVMLCSDDKHPDDLQAGHINQLAARAIALGHSVFDVLRCACINPVLHYGLSVGQLKVGDAMDAVELAGLHELKPLKTWISGAVVAEKGKSHIVSTDTPACNQFNARKVSATDFLISAVDQVRVIKVFDGELLTEEWQTAASTEQGYLVPDTQRDILLLTVINRYQAKPPSIALIHGFGLQQGALVSTVAHDSHNIIAVAADIDSLCLAVNRIIDQQGGIAVAQQGKVDLLPLPIAGLMSDQDGDTVAARYTELDQAAKQLGSPLRAPFMTLSFMALLVIPELKLSDQGLFDGRSFQFTDLKV